MRRNTINNVALTDIESSNTALTQQDFYQTVEDIANLPIGENYKRSFDIVDPYGNIGHVILFRNRDGYLFAAAGSPDPRCLWKKLNTNQKLDKIILAHRPEWLSSIS